MRRKVTPKFFQVVVFKASPLLLRRLKEEPVPRGVLEYVSKRKEKGLTGEVTRFEVVF